METNDNKEVTSKLVNVLDSMRKILYDINENIILGIDEIKVDIESLREETYFCENVDCDWNDTDRRNCCAMYTSIENCDEKVIG